MQAAGIEKPVWHALRFLGNPNPADGTLGLSPRLPATSSSLGVPTPHSPPRRPVLFWELKYEADFLFRSFIFSWEQLWRPRKKSLLSPGSRSILHLLWPPLRIPATTLHRRGNLKWRALLFRSLSLVSASRRLGQARREPGKGNFCQLPKVAVS